MQRKGTRLYQIANNKRSGTLGQAVPQLILRGYGPTGPIPGTPAMISMTIDYVCTSGPLHTST